MKIIPIRRALLSVSDKNNLPDFANNLHSLGIELISTGGTSELLEQHNVPFRSVETLTGLPEMLDGRVKTLHPKIHGGILGRRDAHLAEAEEHAIEWIDLVVVNFYPFEAVIAKNPTLSWEEAVEYIDVGGPTMVRAAAKNFAWVGVVVDPADYASIIEEIKTHGGLTFETRQRLAQKVFTKTAQYDGAIQRYFSKEQSDNLSLDLQKVATLRYGENPHQEAHAYQFKNTQSGVLSATQHQGKPLSYNNILDAQAAYTCLQEFTTPTCVIVKHANPCGVATRATIKEAYAAALKADAASAFGGIVAMNQTCDAETASAITQIFMEVILAPAYTEEALAIFASKPNLRVLTIPTEAQAEWEMKFIDGGMLLQQRDLHVLGQDDLQIVTEVKPTEADFKNMQFAWQVLKHIKSNGILIAKENTTVGIGAGQVSRVDAVEMAILKAGQFLNDTILASDAFFPFRDSIDRLAKTGVRAIIQPGGSIRDEEVIAACNEHGIAMVFTGKRCFKH